MGIANIVNTAGGGGGSSEIITNLVNSVDGAGLRLANQGYISCADVSANRFGTNDFSVEFVLSQETSAINADIFISNLNGSNQAVDAAVIRWDVIQNDNIQLVFTNSGAAETAYNFGYDPAPDLNEPTHYLVSADRSGNAVLYRNGAEIASVSIAASGSANVGNSGQPTVIGSPVNNFGVKGNVYRFRTYSKALSSDEAKNVFDRADVPTALVSNLLLDLDCAYANPTQSTVIQDRGPNNQDGTLNGTITQTNVIKQLNSTSARIGTFAATPADGQILADGKAKTAPSYSFGHTTATGMYSPGANQIRFSTASTDRLTIASDGAVSLGPGTAAVTTLKPSLLVTDTDVGGSITIRGQSPILAFDKEGSGTGTILTDGGGLTVKDGTLDSHGNTHLTIDQYGNAIFKKSTGAYLQLSDASAVRGSIHCTTSDGLVFSTGAGFTERMTIASTGDITSTNATGSKPILTLENTTNDANSSQLLFLKNRTATNNDNLGTVRFRGNNNAGTPEVVEYATIYAQSTNVAESEEDGKLIFRTMKDGNLAPRLTIASNGVAEFSNGINLGDTTLSNYEQGTFTLTDASGAGLTITGGLGRYTRIGNTVHVTVQFTMPTTSNSSAMKLSGLPYAVPNDNDYRGLVLNYSNRPSVEYALSLYNSDDIDFYTDAGAVATNADGSGGGFFINGHYKV